MKAAAVGARTAASPAPAAGLLCAGCAKGLPKAGYSGAQLKRKAKRRCKACVTGGVQLGLQPAAAGSGQLDMDQEQLNQMLGALALTSASSLQQRGGSGGGGGETEEEVEEVRERRGSPLQTGLPELQAQLDAWCGALDRVDGLEAGGAGLRRSLPLLLGAVPNRRIPPGRRHQIVLLLLRLRLSLSLRLRLSLRLLLLLLLLVRCACLSL